MKTSRSLAAVLTAIALTAFAPVAAQEPVRDFAQLNTRLKPGDTVYVTDAQGREIKGKIVSLAPGAVTVKADASRTYGPADVNLIQERRPDSMKNGALIGFAVGCGAGIACLASVEDQDRGWCLAAALFYGGVGAGIGVLIDVLIPGRKIVAYRAPGSAGAAPARVSLAPLVNPRAKGVAVSFAF